MQQHFQSGNLLFTAGKTIFITACIALLATIVLWPIAALIPLGFLAFSLYFFRNPQRRAPHAHELELISPADGVVLSIEELDNQKKIAIFLSPFDVHVNWIPCNARVVKQEYRPGKFLVAYAPKSSDINERYDIHLERTLDNHPIVVRQIAGFIARRIICWIQDGQELSAGHKYGMIRFGSRVELFMPDTAQILTYPGQRLTGGHDIIAYLPRKES